MDNIPFENFLTRVLKENVHSINDPVLKSLAEWQKEGLVYIYKVNADRIGIGDSFFFIIRKVPMVTTLTIILLILTMMINNIRWLHISDERNPPPWGRIPYPEDIIGTVFVQGGVIQPNTYQPMPTHRLATSNGFMQLSEPLTQCLIREAKRIASKQKQ